MILPNFFYTFYSSEKKKKKKKLQNKHLNWSSPLQNYVIVLSLLHEIQWSQNLGSALTENFVCSMSKICNGENL